MPKRLRDLTSSGLPNPFSRPSLRWFVSEPRFASEIATQNDPAYPRISIVVPSFNQGDFLERTLLSILNQNYPNLELFVIDGGSTDQSPRILERYDRFITQWVSEKDRGQCDAINKGMALATGDILAYLNSDDIYLPGNVLHEVADSFRGRFDEPLLVHSDIYLIDADDRIQRLAPALPFRPREYIHGVSSIGQQGAFWTRPAFDRAGGFNIHNRTSLDGEFFLRTAVNGTRFERADAVWGGFRIHSQSQTGSRDTRFIQERWQELARLQREFPHLNGNSRLFQAERAFYLAKYFPYKALRRLNFHIGTLKDQS